MPTQVTEIVVNGQLFRYFYQAEYPPIPHNPDEYINDTDDDDTIGGGQGPVCEDTSNMTEQQKLKVFMEFVVSQLRKQVLAMPNQRREYGAFIVRKSDGTVVATPLKTLDYRAFFDENDLPKNQYNHPDYTSVIGIFHSHPEYNIDPSRGIEVRYYNPNDPDRLLYPSHDYVTGGQTVGDWITAGVIRNNKINQGGDPHFDIFVAGYREYFGVGDLHLRRYDWSDAYTTSAQDHVPHEPLPPCREP